MSKYYLDAIDKASGMQCRRMDGEGGGFNPPGTEERKGPACNAAEWTERAADSIRLEQKKEKGICK